MKLLLDTHLLLWAAAFPDKLPKKVYEMLIDNDNELYFSAASIWEISIKKGLKRADFQVEVSVLKRALLDNGYMEIPITSQHAVFVENLPEIHKDPFDRILIAQANVEGIMLYTNDKIIPQYHGPIKGL